MSYFKAKMHQIRFQLGLRPIPRWGRGPTSKVEGNGGRGGVDPQGFAEMPPLLHVRPGKGEVCFTVSDVRGVDLPPMVGG